MTMSSDCSTLLELSTDQEMIIILANVISSAVFLYLSLFCSHFIEDCWEKLAERILRMN